MIRDNPGGSLMPDWSIMFVPAQYPTPDKPADFQLDSPDTERGASVQVF